MFLLDFAADSLSGHAIQVIGAAVALLMQAERDVFGTEHHDLAHRGARGRHTRPLVS
jgi:hypothetical protein